MPQMMLSVPAMKIMIPANSSHPEPLTLSSIASPFSRIPQAGRRPTLTGVIEGVTRTRSPQGRPHHDLSQAGTRRAKPAGRRERPANKNRSSGINIVCLMAIRVVLAEDSYIAREGIEHVLEKAPEIEVVGTCEDLDSLLSAIQADSPDVVVTDIRMPPTKTLKSFSQNFRLS